MTTARTMGYSGLCIMSACLRCCVGLRRMREDPLQVASVNEVAGLKGILPFF